MERGRTSYDALASMVLAVGSCASRVRAQAAAQAKVAAEEEADDALRVRAKADPRASG